MTLNLLWMILFFTSKKEINRTALNKLLFFADLYSYIINDRKTLSGEDYLKKPYGPVPRNISVARRTLLDHSLLEEKKHIHSFFYEYGYLAKGVDAEKLQEKIKATDEKNILDATYKALSNETASSLSEASHAFEPWKSAENWGDVLDFNKAIGDQNLLTWMKKKGFQLKVMETAGVEPAS